MMYSEFIDRTGFGESYITPEMYHKHIEPVYLDAPETMDKDAFCKVFYDLHMEFVTNSVNAAINKISTNEKLKYINAEKSEAFEAVEKFHKALLQDFLTIMLPMIIK